VRDSEPKRFDRAALRWHGRYCREVADVTLEEGQAVLALLAALKGERPPAAARALADLFDRRLLLQASEALMRTLEVHAARRRVGRVPYVSWKRLR
jgi:hypothetical protein